MKLRDAVRPLRGLPSDLDPLIELIGDARLVLLGEASHGTHEFYEIRAELSKRLIAGHGFAGLAVEADWPDAYRINAFVRGNSQDRSPEAALGDFRRFPQWMWRNTVVRDLVAWMRRDNDRLGSPERKAGFWGIDLYSLNRSADAVVRYLEKVDPDAAGRARYRYGCFEDFGEDPQAYGYSASFGMKESCQQQVLQQLTEMQRRAAELASRDGMMAEDDFFFAEQNAQLVKNAEEYYRTMFSGRVSSWNLRDRHMVDTLAALLAHLDRRRGRSKLIVWAHNSHLGDARATDMAARGEWNVGQLVRERWPGECVLVGFTTYTGTVTAASDWDAPAELKQVRPGLPESYERLFHDVGEANFLLVRPSGLERRLERAIGVIYRPETERVSHYFHCDLPRQFDAVIHIDTTRALEALPPAPELHVDAPETFPAGV